MIKQIGSEGMVFFIFSAADSHWPELYKLITTNKNNEDDDSMRNRIKIY